MRLTLLVERQTYRVFPSFGRLHMAFLKFSNKIEQALCLSTVGISLLFVVLSLTALFTANKTLMLVAAILLLLSILLTVGLLVYPEFFQKSSDE